MLERAVFTSKDTLSVSVFVCLVWSVACMRSACAINFLLQETQTVFAFPEHKILIFFQPPTVKKEDSKRLCCLIVCI